MATSSPLDYCIKCPKGRGQVVCGGCQQWFCVKHLLEHRQELSQQMDTVLLEHDQLQQDLTQKDHNNGKHHSLISQIDQWELQSIERIRTVAHKARQQVKESFGVSKSKIEKSLRSITAELHENRQTESYTEIDLMRWTNQLRKLAKKFNNSPMIEMKNGNGAGVPSIHHLSLIQLHILPKDKVWKNSAEYISNGTRWSMNGQTVAGGQGQGDALNQLNCPHAVNVDDDGTLIIADTYNHRIIRWKSNTKQGEIITKKEGRGNRIGQLYRPTSVLIDRINDVLIVIDCGNRRVIGWYTDEDETIGNRAEILIANIKCGGLTMDDEGSLYVSDWDKHEIRRYGYDDGSEGVIVAGGNGQGNALNQFNGPGSLFVSDDRSVFVSDSNNNRVMKWMKNAKEGLVVAGGLDKRNDLEILTCPAGIFIDQMESVYVVDQGNHRVMRWTKDAKQGEVIVGGNGRGSQNNQLCWPTSMSFDNKGNLYVVDQDNHRIQRFNIQ